MTDAVVDDPMLDEGWLAAPVKRSRFRVVVVAILAAALCFLGGALVQKQYGASAASDALPTGLAQGGFPGSAGGLPEGLPSGLPGGLPGSTASGTDDSSDSDAGAVIGTVVAVHGDVWVVKDLGGQRHRVHVGDETDVVTETDVDPADVRVGDSVDVDGTTDGGQLLADNVTLR